jgi:IS66 C-terminal element
MQLQSRWDSSGSKAVLRGGRTAAILASLTSACRRHDIDPHLYLTQLLTNLPGAPIGQLRSLLPDQRRLFRAA